MLLEKESEPSCKRQRRSRKKRQGERLLSTLKTTLARDGKVTVLGEDMLFKALLNDPGCDTPISATCQILFNQTPLTVVGVPDRLWNKSVPREKFFRTRKRMEDLGRRCILLPQSALGYLATGSSDQPSALHLAFDYVAAQTLCWCNSPDDTGDHEAVAGFTSAP